MCITSITSGNPMELIAALDLFTRHLLTQGCTMYSNRRQPGRIVRAGRDADSPWKRHTLSRSFRTRARGRDPRRNVSHDFLVGQRSLVGPGSLQSGFRQSSTSRRGEGTESFLRLWTASLDPLLTAWLTTSVAREARERASDGMYGSVVTALIEVLLEACADAHGVSIGELRLLVPSIDTQCAEFVLAEWTERAGQARASGRR
jgi:hypothetical protein